MVSVRMTLTGMLMVLAFATLMCASENAIGQKVWEDPTEMQTELETPIEVESRDDIRDGTMESRPTNGPQDTVVNGARDGITDPRENDGNKQESPDGAYGNDRFD
jgi:hypothetical protein